MKSWVLNKQPELVAYPMEPQAYAEILVALTEILYQSLSQTSKLPDHDTTRLNVSPRRKRVSS